MIWGEAMSRQVLRTPQAGLMDSQDADRRLGLSAHLLLAGRVAGSGKGKNLRYRKSVALRSSTVLNKTVSLTI